jgi:hypothetical protein
VCFVDKKAFKAPQRDALLALLRGEVGAATPPPHTHAPLPLPLLQLPPPTRRYRCPYCTPYCSLRESLNPRPFRTLHRSPPWPRLTPGQVGARAVFKPGELFAGRPATPAAPASLAGAAHA